MPDMTGGGANPDTASDTEPLAEETPTEDTTQDAPNPETTAGS
jgi:hypothetical protein